MELRKNGSLLACLTASCVLAGAARPSVTAPCQLYANDTSSRSCWVWDLSSVPQHNWDVNTSTCPDDCNVFRVASPCSLADNYGCRPGSGSNKPAPAYQESNTDRSCYALGNLDCRNPLFLKSTFFEMVISKKVDYGSFPADISGRRGHGTSVGVHRRRCWATIYVPTSLQRQRPRGA
eukprot:m.349592 g.349592  ORF g.349592 m.349592 type:complete len:178 (+) comp16575_c0_seq6:1345-1878(+)